MKKLILITLLIASTAMAERTREEYKEYVYFLLRDPEVREYVKNILVPKYQELVKAEIKEQNKDPQHYESRPLVAAAFKVRAVALQEAEKRYPKDVEMRLSFFEQAAMPFEGGMEELNKLAE
jgi:hypothetical protein